MLRELSLKINMLKMDVETYMNAIRGGNFLYSFNANAMREVVQEIDKLPNVEEKRRCFQEVLPVVEQVANFNTKLVYLVRDITDELVNLGVISQRPHTPEPISPSLCTPPSSPVKVCS